MLNRLVSAAIAVTVITAAGASFAADTKAPVAGKAAAKTSVEKTIDTKKEETKN